MNLIYLEIVLTLRISGPAKVGIHAPPPWPREALLQILYGQYLILGVFGSCMF